MIHNENITVDYIESFQRKYLSQNTHKKPYQNKKSCTILIQKCVKKIKNKLRRISNQIQFFTNSAFSSF